jgi:hypothetical protein
MCLYQENILKHVLKCAVLGSTTLVPTYHVCEAGVMKADYTHNVQFWKARLELCNSQNCTKPITLQVVNIAKIMIILLYG